MILLTADGRFLKEEWVPPKRGEDSGRNEVAQLETAFDVLECWQWKIEFEPGVTARSLVTAVEGLDRYTLLNELTKSNLRNFYQRIHKPCTDPIWSESENKDPLEFLEFYRVTEIGRRWALPSGLHGWHVKADSHEEDAEYCGPEELKLYCDIHGIRSYDGPEVDDPNEADENGIMINPMGYKKGEQVNYSIYGVPMTFLFDLPLVLNEKFEPYYDPYDFSDEYEDIKEGHWLHRFGNTRIKKPLRDESGKLLVNYPLKTLLPWKLGEVLEAFFSEVTWRAAPSRRKRRTKKPA